MSTHHTLYRSITVAALMSLALAGCNDDAGDAGPITPPKVEQPATMQPPSEAMPMPPTPPVPATLTALDVTAVTLGSAANADGMIAEPLTRFAADDDIVVSVDTDGAASAAEVTARLISADGQLAAEQSVSITTTGAETSAIVFDAGPWQPGDYKVEIWINGVRSDAVSKFTVE